MWGGRSAEVGLVWIDETRLVDIANNPFPERLTGRHEVQILGSVDYRFGLQRSPTWFLSQPQGFEPMDTTPPVHDDDSMDWMS
jgi:hypothetical protein